MRQQEEGGFLPDFELRHPRFFPRVRLGPHTIYPETELPQDSLDHPGAVFALHPYSGGVGLCSDAADMQGFLCSNL